MVARAAEAGLAAAAAKARQLGEVEAEEECKLMAQATGLEYELAEQRMKQLSQMNRALETELSSRQVRRSHCCC